MALLYACPASAAFLTGNDIYEYCRAVSPVRFGLCLGYIEGIADVLEVGSIFGYRACVPGTVKVEQLRDIVVQFLFRDAAMREVGAVPLVAQALSGAFPCR